LGRAWALVWGAAGPLAGDGRGWKWGRSRPGRLVMPQKVLALQRKDDIKGDGKMVRKEIL
jgi:hypothetical protein